MAKNPFGEFLRRPGLGETFPPIPSPTPGISLPPTKPRVFIVHGHNLGILAQVEVFVLKANRKSVVLKDQSRPGKTLLDELVQLSRGVQFAIVILSADDVGRGKNEPDDQLRYRGRQNAVFEFGFLIQQLGRVRVFVLHEQGVEMPSDYGGVIYIPYDTNGAWKVLLAKAVKAAGIPINVSSVI
ncbi:MAG: nucleotide-binding protein [Chloroflexota bacterium]